MCGIVGIVNFNNETVSKEILTKMTKTLEHRGPDKCGFYIYNNIGFGHTRLSILDLSRLGDQPMKSEDDNYVLNYNGEIYNYKEIRKELILIGYKFFSNSDTEVLLKSWIEWGEKVLKKLNGMFAFSLFDKKKNYYIL